MPISLGKEPMINISNYCDALKMSARVDETGRLNFGSLLTLLPPDVRSLTRKIEKTTQKVINRSYGVVFIETCLRGESARNKKIHNFGPIGLKFGYYM